MWALSFTQILGTLVYYDGNKQGLNCFLELKRLRLSILLLHHFLFYEVNPRHINQILILRCCGYFKINGIKLIKKENNYKINK